MRLQSIGARLSSTVGVAIVSSVITTTLLTGGYAVATTFLPDNSVSSINIVDGTIRRGDLSPSLRARIGRVFGVVVVPVDNGNGDPHDMRVRFDGAEVPCVPAYVGTSYCATVLPVGTRVRIHVDIVRSGAPPLSDIAVRWGGGAAACGITDICVLTVDRELAVTATYPATP